MHIVLGIYGSWDYVIVVEDPIIFIIGYTLRIILIDHENTIDFVASKSNEVIIIIYASKK